MKLGRARVWVLLPLLMTGCAKEFSSKVAQDRIYTDYRVTYDDTSKELKATATFYFGEGATGTLLELDGASQVTFNGAAMPKKTTVFDSVHYEAVVASPGAAALDQSNVFVYTDNDGKAYTNTVSGLGSLKTQYPPSAALAGSLNVAWTASKAWGSEWLNLSYSGTQAAGGKAQSGSEVMPIPAQGSLSGNAMVATERLKNWGAGAYKVQICRESSSTKPQQAPGAGGRLFSSTCDAKADVKVLQ